MTDGLAATLARGEAARAAALALPSVEELPPPWLEVSSETRVEQAAE